MKTSTGIWSVVYNAENRPTSFTNADSGTIVECSYDYMGRRATKKVTVNGSVTLHQRFLYRGYLQIACCDLTRSNHPCLWLITWDPSQPVATRPLAIQKDGTWYTYGWDLTKNVCEVYGQHGYIRTKYSYAPYGGVFVSGDVTQPIQWSAECYDNELDVVYYNYRYYNTITGRWINRDPDETNSNGNKYVFASNNIFKNDILGLAERVLYSNTTVTCQCGTSLSINVGVSFGWNLDFIGVSNLSITGSVSYDLPCDLTFTGLASKPGLEKGELTLRAKFTLSWTERVINDVTISVTSPTPTSTTRIVKENYKLDISNEIVKDTSKNCCPK